LSLTYRAKVRLSIKRFASFLKVFRRNRRGAIGIAILIFFGGMALGAPLLTPYHPTVDELLAGPFGAPAWLRYLPGGAYLSVNMKIATEPGFSTADSIHQWHIAFSSSPSSFNVQHILSVGNPFGSGPGSAAITFRREEIGTTYGNATVTLTREFEYPYNGMPERFIGDIALTVDGTGEVEGEGVTSLDAPIALTIFIQRVGGERYDLWPAPYPDNPLGTTSKGTIQNVLSTWVTSKASAESRISTISSLSRSVKRRLFGNPDTPENPLRTVFNPSTLPSRYIYGLEIVFQDLDKPDKRVETTMYIDDFDLTLLGTSFGLLGTDHYGRDIFSQLVYGSRLSLYIGLLAAVLSVVLGLIVGLAAGYIGGVADEITMRLTDMLLVLPTLPLLIVLVAVLGPRLTNLILLIGFLGWMGFARMVRAQVLSLKERPFVEAAKAIGSGKIHIITVHILPNVMSLVYITLALSVPNAIVIEAALSWLGFYDPTVMSWGRMLRDVQVEAQATGNWWWVVPPGLSIALIALSFILIGFALDEILNPKLRVRR